MRSVWVIFRKDIRRLWWQIAIVILLQAVLAREDRWRSDTYVGMLESWLNLLLPLAWACLIAQAVHGEPLIGDREFWMTRPYRRPQLLAAKALFVLVFVQAPAFIAGFWIVASRALLTSSTAPHLLGKQLAILCAITLPAMALAAIVRNFMQFVFVMIVAPVAALVLASGFRGPLPIAEPFRYETLAAVLTAAALAILFFQFIRRRTRFSRIVGASAVVAAVALYVFPLPGLLGQLQAEASAAPFQPSLQVLPPSVPAADPGPNQVWIDLPLKLSGIPEGTAFQGSAQELEITGPAGRRLRSFRFVPYRQYRKVDLTGSAYLNSNSGAGSILLNLSRPAYDALKDQPVTISAEFGLSLFQTQPAVPMAIGGSATVPGVGHCQSEIQEWQFSQAGIKVECESAGGEPPLTFIQIDGRKLELWAPRGYRTDPWGAWLSPIERRQASFALLPAGSTRPANDHWHISEEMLATSHIEITPEKPIGYVYSQYSFSGINLKDYIRKQSGL